MKVLQLIDSLDAGGAERIAVTFANVLASEIEASHLCTTRAEGVLRSEVDSKVMYHFVQKKKTLDFKAAFRLKKYIKANGIDVVHAHTTSYFFASLLKLIYPKIRLYWHTHLGERVNSNRSDNKALYLCSFLFSGIITVNDELRDWCLKNLAAKSVVYLPNFVDIRKYDNVSEGHREKRIVCLANLKHPKNHVNLIEAFAKVSSSYPEWKLQLAGKDFGDDYSKVLKNKITELALAAKVELLGQQTEVEILLSGASIGVLSSDSEGLPIALLEYGAAGLPVVATEVGYCKTVVAGNGLLAPPGDPDALARALESYLQSDEKRREDGDKFKQHVRKNYSVTAVLPKLLAIYKP